jgi:predicted SprT family Zn-dependent metalloprotease
VLNSRKLAWAADTARKLMERHGLSNWTFRFNKSRTYTGLCFAPPVARIELSALFVSRNPEAKVVGTILHEIAHGVCGAFIGHNNIWRAKCLEIGGDPEVVVDANMPPIGKWAATCLGCRTDYYRRRQPSEGLSFYCRTCGPILGRLFFCRRGSA